MIRDKFSAGNILQVALPVSQMVLIFYDPYKKPWHSLVSTSFNIKSTDWNGFVRISNSLNAITPIIKSQILKDVEIEYLRHQMPYDRALTLFWKGVYRTFKDAGF